jgi:hypothetical protein
MYMPWSKWETREEMSVMHEAYLEAERIKAKV